MESFQLDDLAGAAEVISDAVGVSVEVAEEVVEAAVDTVAGEDVDVDVEQQNTLEALIVAASPVFNPDPLFDDDKQTRRAKSKSLQTALMEAESNGVSVKPVETHLDVAASVRILNQVFAPEANSPYYPPSLLRNIIAAGSSVLLAYDAQGQAVGTILSLPAWGDNGYMIQSGPMAVLPEGRGKKVSLALKYAQLSWGIERGLSEIRWSFDLLDKRLARLNLHTLGVDVVSFLPGFEGVRDTDDDGTIPNDRLLVKWDLKDLDSEKELPDMERFWGVRAVDGAPVVKDWSGKPLVYLELPDDITSLRREIPELAALWQQHVGGALKQALDDGYDVTVSSKGTYRLLKI